jgi:RNA polymerase sigma factor (sigma-70 family)
VRGNGAATILRLGAFLEVSNWASPPAEQEVSIYGFEMSSWLSAKFFLSDSGRRWLFIVEMTDGQQLLADYVENRSELAFRELVGRYIDLVYSTAIRGVAGDRHIAEDVVQIVFADLARMAKGIPRDIPLGGWLHRHTCYVAANVIRSEQRRQSRERQAVEMNELESRSDDNFSQWAPLLDEAINQLNAPDRAAIMLRFFEQRDLRAVGVALGSNEDAAQKRVSRALEKLRGLLVRRGVALSGTALASLLATEAVTAAPAGLAASVSASALAGSAAASGAAFTLLKLMTMTKLKTLAVSAVVVAGVGTTLVLEHRAQTRLRDENRALLQQYEQFAALQGENATLSNQLANIRQTDSMSKEQLSELMRLRGEVASLRSQKDQLEKSRKENRPLPTAPNAQPAQRETEGEDKNFPKASWAFVGYATPEAAFQSTVWALSNGDVKTMLGSMAPAELERVQRELADKSESEIAAKFTAEFEKVKGFRILKKESLSEDEVILTLYVEGLEPNEGTPRMKLQRVGGEWKTAGPYKDRPK